MLRVGRVQAIGGTPQVDRGTTAAIFRPDAAVVSG
jgi:hypothetical protein